MISYKETQRHRTLHSYTDVTKKHGGAKMATLKEAAQAYSPQLTRNIADLPEVNIEAINLEDREGTDNEGQTFKYKVIVVSGEDYRVPGSVIGSIKGILAKKPDLKRISVSKQGQGMNTRYTVIPIL